MNFKYKISVVSMFKNEEMIMEEWIQHYINYKLFGDAIGFGVLSNCSSPSTSLIIFIQQILTSLHFDL